MNNDLISRSDLKKAIETYDKFACLPDCKLEPFRNLEHPEMFEPYVHLRDILNAIDKAPTVEPDMEFAKWVTKMIFDNNEVEDFDFELFSELACRKLEKLGLVKKTKSEWVEMKEGGDEK